MDYLVPQYKVFEAKLNQVYVELRRHEVDLSHRSKWVFTCVG